MCDPYNLTAGQTAAQTTLRGASIFDDNHAFTKTMQRFAELVEEKYEGDVEFDLRLNAEMGDHGMLVMGAPIQAQIFAALTGAPSAIAHNEVITQFRSV